VVVGNGRGLSELLVRQMCAAMVENKLICALLLNMHMCLPIFALDGTSAVDDEVGCTNWVPGRRSTGAHQDLSSLLGLFSVDERLQTMSSLLGLFSVNEHLQTTVEEQYVLEIDQFGRDLLQGHLEESA
jgi:hypothetical protein